MSTAFPARLGGVTLICAYTKTLEEEMSRLEQTVQMFKIGGFVASPPSQPLQLVFVPILAPDYPLIRFLCFDNPIPLRGIATPKKVGFLISLPAPPYEKLCGDCASRLDIGCGGGKGRKICSPTFASTSRLFPCLRVDLSNGQFTVFWLYFDCISIYMLIS